MTKKLGLTTKYIIAISFMLLFVFNDLLFDFAFSFQSSDIIAFVFTFLSALIVFGCNWRLKRNEAENTYLKANKFIKSNFDNAQVVFSILDIICGLISIFSSYIYLSCFVKAVKFIYIPTKVLVVINKEKSLLKPITKFSYLWTSIRLIEKSGGNMVNFMKSNKWTIIIGFFLSAVLGACTYFALPTVVTLPLWASIVIAVAVFVIAYALIFFLGKDGVDGLVLRLAQKVLSKERYEELVKFYEKLEYAQKIDEQAKKQYEAEKKTVAKETKTVDVEFERAVAEKVAQLRVEEAKANQTTNN